MPVVVNCLETYSGCAAVEANLPDVGLPKMEQNNADAADRFRRADRRR